MGRVLRSRGPERRCARSRHLPARSPAGIFPVRPRKSSSGLVRPLAPLAEPDLKELVRTNPGGGTAACGVPVPRNTASFSCVFRPQPPSLRSGLRPHDRARERSHLLARRGAPRLSGLGRRRDSGERTYAATTVSHAQEQRLWRPCERWSRPGPSWGPSFWTNPSRSRSPIG